MKRRKLLKMFYKNKKYQCLMNTLQTTFHPFHYSSDYDMQYILHRIMNKVVYYDY